VWAHSYTRHAVGGCGLHQSSHNRKQTRSVSAMCVLTCSRVFAECQVPFPHFTMSISTSGSCWRLAAAMSTLLVLGLCSTSVQSSDTSVSTANARSLLQTRQGDCMAIPGCARGRCLTSRDISGAATAVCPVCATRYVPSNGRLNCGEFAVGYFQGSLQVQLDHYCRMPCGCCSCTSSSSRLSHRIPPAAALGSFTVCISACCCNVCSLPQGHLRGLHSSQLHLRGLRHRLLLSSERQQRCHCARKSNYACQLYIQGARVMCTGLVPLVRNAWDAQSAPPSHTTKQAMAPGR
jgi:hypothetical protein